jgi:nicotinamidase/pyrazinamidase
MENDVAFDTHTALIIVDVQNDFADPGGSLYVSGGREIVPLINKHVDAALGGGGTVVYTQDWHPPSTPHFQKDGGIWPVHCVEGTWGARFHPDLHVRGQVVRKGSGGEDGYSGFAVRDPASGDIKQTPLEDVLRERSIEKVVIAGLATDYCVKETAVDAIRLGFETVLLKQAVRAVDLQPGDGARALEAVREAGAKIS